MRGNPFNGSTLGGGYLRHEQRRGTRLDSLHQFTTVRTQRILAQLIHVDWVVRLIHVDWLSRLSLLDRFNWELRVGPQRAVGRIEVRRDVLEEQPKLGPQVCASHCSARSRAGASTPFSHPTITQLIFPVWL